MAFRCCASAQNAKVGCELVHTPVVGVGNRQHREWLLRKRTCERGDEKSGTTSSYKRSIRPLHAKVKHSAVRSELDGDLSVCVAPSSVVLSLEVDHREVDLIVVDDPVRQRSPERRPRATATTATTNVRVPLPIFRLVRVRVGVRVRVRPSRAKGRQSHRRSDSHSLHRAGRRAQPGAPVCSHRTIDERPAPS